MPSAHRAGVRVRIAAVVALAIAGAAVGWLVGAGKTAEASQVTFLGAAEIGPNPFTPPADVRGHTTVKGAGPFGGTGSNFVCDRELLIRLLEQRPARLRAWAKVEGIAPTRRAVAKYIRSLRPATLVRDTRVTNHGFKDGHAVAFQASLAAGTAVLVDSAGAIRARCRCGNPLLDPALFATEECVNCPSDHKLASRARLASLYYFPYPDPPLARGERRTPAERARANKRRTIVVTKIVPETNTVTFTERVPGTNRTVTRTIRVPIHDVRVRTIKVPTTVTLERTVTVTVPQTVTQTETVVQTQTVTETQTQTQTVTNTQTVPAPVTITVTASGPGNADATAATASERTCPTTNTRRTCSLKAASTDTVTLTATPTESFLGWSGDAECDRPTAAQCLTPAGTRQITASFEQPGT
ncbi:MAG TPA: DUF6777 domain-containing protein, partial [Nocardioidaceae bacterium]|nr:DUF6777 domain-containing protein [Nocardioidaceae bacterium]